MLVSVIIPCFNVEEYISECLESVLSQVYPYIEIVCIDNNSTDNTLSILKEYEKNHPYKICVLQEVKNGASAARNKGLPVAKGEWIQFLDADDILFPEKIEQQARLVIKKNNAGFIAGGYVKQKMSGEKYDVNIALDDPWKAVFITNLGITSANLFKADAIKEVKGFNEELESSQESDLMFRLLKSGFEVIIDHKCNTVIRERKWGQISQRNSKEKWLQYVALRLDIIDYLKENKPSYFCMESNFFYEKLFSFIRTLAIYDLQKAVEIYKSYYDCHYIPERNLANTRYYVMLFKLLGFKNTERVKRLMNKIKI